MKLRKANDLPRAAPDNFIRNLWEFSMKLRKAIDLMHEGSILMQMNKSGDARAWYLVPGGEIADDTAQEIIKMKNVHSGNDGLFPGISQTWRMKT